MALDFQQVQSKVREMGESVRVRQDDLRTRREAAMSLLQTFAQETEALREKVQRGVAADSSLRCALPVFGLDGSPQPLDGHYPYHRAQGNRPGSDGCKST
jgi:hypothetical protein